MTFGVSEGLVKAFTGLFEGLSVPRHELLQWNRQKSIQNEWNWNCAIFQEPPYNMHTVRGTCRKGPSKNEALGISQI